MVDENGTNIPPISRIETTQQFREGLGGFSSRSIFDKYFWWLNILIIPFVFDNINMPHWFHLWSWSPPSSLLLATKLWFLGTSASLRGAAEGGGVFPHIWRNIMALSLVIIYTICLLWYFWPIHNFNSFYWNYLEEKRQPCGNVWFVYLDS